MKMLARLEDFRLLPVFVAVSMALGILIGKTVGISDYELTPPIDAALPQKSLPQVRSL